LPLGLGGEERRPGVTHRLIYFAYGIFHGPPNKEHWTLRAELDLKLPQYEINVWSYPQVPERSASTTIPHLENAYRMLARTAKGKRIQITFMGESGGNIALVLVICAVSEVWRGQSEGGPQGICSEKNIFAICSAIEKTPPQKGKNIPRQRCH
jgi:hypothetical protein